MIRRILNFSPFIIVIVVSYFAKEFYPLSSFPMYSKFDDRTYYTYLRNSSEEELPTVDTAKMFASQLKKRYGNELKELKKDYKGSHYDWTPQQRTKAGEATLDWLQDSRGVKLPRGTELMEVRIFYRDGKLVKEETPVGSVKTRS